MGVAVSLLGLGFAIWQLLRLRGETRAAKEAAEETRVTVRRDLAISEASRLSERLQSLKDLHRKGDWSNALALYPEIRKGLIYIQNRYPGLSEDDSQTIQHGNDHLLEMERSAEVDGKNVSPVLVTEFNSWLSEIQIKLAQLESR